MPIDWFTVVAQIINFLILVWLLKRFLYKPILNAIDDREKRIATDLAQAEARMAEAQRERDDFQQKNAAFDRQSAGLLKAATDAAGTERQRLFDEARTDADLLRCKRQAALQNEQQKLSSEIARWTQQEVFEIAKKTLVDLAGTSLEQRIGEVFVKQLRSISGVEKEQLIVALNSVTDPVTVRSAFELPQSIQTEIEAAIKDLCGTEAQFQFQNVPAIISGIEVSANGQKVAWSIAEYLANLEKSVGEILHTNPEVDARSTLEDRTRTAAHNQVDLERDHQPTLASSAAKGD